MQNLGQFTNADTFVNTGYTLAISHDDYDVEAEEETVAKSIIMTNEVGNLCFAYNKTTWPDKSSEKN